MIVGRVARGDGATLFVLGLSASDIRQMLEQEQTIFVDPRDELPALIVLARDGDDAEVAGFVRATVHQALGMTGG